MENKCERHPTWTETFRTFSFFFLSVINGLSPHPERINALVTTKVKTVTEIITPVGVKVPGWNKRPRGCWFDAACDSWLLLMHSRSNASVGLWKHPNQRKSKMNENQVAVDEIKNSNINVMAETESREEQCDITEKRIRNCL